MRRSYTNGRRPNDDGENVLREDDGIEDDDKAWHLGNICSGMMNTQHCVVKMTRIAKAKTNARVGRTHVLIDARLRVGGCWQKSRCDCDATDAIVFSS